MKRRAFLVASTMASTAAAFPRLLASSTQPEYDASIALPLDLARIWDTATIAKVGELYRLLAPQENNEETLVNLLLRNKKTVNTDLVSALALAIQQDFESAKIVTIDGWILSVSEARQCALFSLRRQD